MNKQETTQLMSIYRQKVDVMKMAVMDIESFIKQYGVEQVTSQSIHDSSGRFDNNGLFSETIFGSISDKRRYTTHGYIDMYVKILNPFIYKMLIDVDSKVEKVLSNQVDMGFNVKSGKFFIPKQEEVDNASNGDDSNIRIGRGMTFFKSCVDEYKLTEDQTNSLNKKASITMLNKNKRKWFISKLLVLPAGIRDIHEEDGRISTDDINNYYRNVLSMSTTYMYLTEKNRNTDVLYDSYTYSLQRKVLDIYNYLYNFFKGKYGYGQKRFGARAVANTSRNVLISNSITADSVDDPSFLNMKQIPLPIIQVVKDYSLLLINKYKELMDIITNIVQSSRVTLVNPDNYSTVYVDISMKERSVHTKNDKINNITNMFIKEEFRKTPVLIKAKDGNSYGISMIYDDTETDTLYISNNHEHILNSLKEDGVVYNVSKLRMMTYYDIFYIILLPIIRNKTTSITRYPIATKWSSQEGHIKIMTTNPSRRIRLNMLYNDIPKIETSLINTIDNTTLNEDIRIVSSDSNRLTVDYSGYPDIVNGSTIDGIPINTIFLAPLGGDHDGDMVGNYSNQSNEANEETTNYINSLSRIVDTNLTFSVGLNTGSVSQLFKYITTKQKNN